ncbi:MAG: CIA30 family protein [Psychromonas sp.]
MGNYNNKIVVSALLAFTCSLYAVDKSIAVTPQVNHPVSTKTKGQQQIMIDLTKQQLRTNWRIGNDDVMGGKSQGNILFKEDHWRFTGNISVENNGGFSSVFYPVQPLSQKISAVNIDIQGDGHRYQLRMVANVNGERLYYYHEFNTVAGQRQISTFSLADFQATFRGRKIANAPILKAEYINEVGFLLTTKQVGEFSLSIFTIDFVTC